MSRPPRLDLASIVASANPNPRGGAAPAARSRRTTEAEIVRLDVSGSLSGAAPVPAPPAERGGTLKERAKQMSVYLEPPVYDQLRDLAYAERTKMHALMLEALDLLFRQRGARSIAQVLGEPPR
ncbi:ribbon-helix-helix domain-containing protein [Methylorubrum zatmanii]|uniref:Ribbon-helix-helix domain-containing protein n=1 Tax=Methylorubrum zatmanii TaxID=29429 RepID=A0ABW1WRE3_9HYPH|nr:ribbon-helix-helix domain-containing protein [Methylorubrum zatmanii]MBD8907357.1 hypothetical protein [Methylorubrum zatmanii]